MYRSLLKTNSIGIQTVGLWRTSYQSSDLRRPRLTTINRNNFICGNLSPGIIVTHDRTNSRSQRCFHNLAYHVGSEYILQVHMKSIKLSLREPLSKDQVSRKHYSYFSTSNLVSEIDNEDGERYHLTDLEMSRIKNQIVPKDWRHWDSKIAELTEFKNQNQHVLVSKCFPNTKLYRWVRELRQQYKACNNGAPTRLDQTKIKQLDDLGFVWDTAEAEWNEKIKLLKEFRQYQNLEHDWEKVIVPYFFKPTSVDVSEIQAKKLRILARWSRSIRDVLSKDEPSTELWKRRVHELKKLGFIWNKQERQWWKQYYSLKEQYNVIASRRGEHEKSKPIEDRVLGPSLALWCNQQRYLYQTWKEAQAPESGGIPLFTKEHYNALSSLRHFSFELDVKYGIHNTMSPNKDEQGEPHKRKSPAKRRSRKRSRDEQFQALLEFKERFGHTFVPQEYVHLPSKDTEHSEKVRISSWKLGYWVMNQRKEYRKMMNGQATALKQEDVEKLKSIGFVFNALDARWHSNYKRLREFYDKHRHFDVSLTKTSENEEGDEATAIKAHSRFQGWVNRQLVEYQKFKQGHRSSLDEDRFKALQEVGFDSVPTWNDMFEELLYYIAKLDGPFTLPMPITESTSRLRYWVRQQRRSYRQYMKGKNSVLTKEQFEKLEKVGFFSISMNSKTNKQVPWDLRFEQLKNFKEKHGHCDVPIDYIETPGLRLWLQRQLKRLQQPQTTKTEEIVSFRGALTAERVAQLKELGLSSELHLPNIEKLSWDDMLKLWKENQAEWDNIPEKSTSTKSSSPLKPSRIPLYWISQQFELRKRISKQNENGISPATSQEVSRYQKLLDAGFFSMYWTRPLEELQLFKSLNGDCDVKAGRMGYTPELAKFVLRVSQEYRKFKKKGFSACWLTSYDVDILDEIGFKSQNFNTKPRDSKLEMLQKFFQDNGHSNVPLNWKENPGLAGWLQQQRRKYGRNQLSTCKVEALEKLNVDWEPDKLEWLDKYQMLQRYVQDHGTSIVHNTQQTLELKQWCDEQRVQHSKRHIPLYREQMLVDIGFLWDIHEVNFAEKLKEMEEFRELHGHCDVPTFYAPNPSLSLWSAVQRHQYSLFMEGKPSSMTNARVEALEDLGFVLHEKNRQWEELYIALEDFRSEHGHCNVPLWNQRNPRLGHFVSFQRKQLELFRQGLPCRLSKTQANLLTKLGL